MVIPFSYEQYALLILLLIKNDTAIIIAIVLSPGQMNRLVCLFSDLGTVVVVQMKLLTM